MTLHQCAGSQPAELGAWFACSTTGQKGAVCRNTGNKRARGMLHAATVTAAAVAAAAAATAVPAAPTHRNNRLVVWPQRQRLLIRCHGFLGVHVEQPGLAQHPPRLCIIRLGGSLSAAKATAAKESNCVVHAMLTWPTAYVIPMLQGMRLNITSRGKNVCIFSTPTSHAFASSGTAAAKHQSRQQDRTVVIQMGCMSKPCGVLHQQGPSPRAQRNLCWTEAGSRQKQACILGC